MAKKNGGEEKMNAGRECGTEEPGVWRIHQGGKGRLTPVGLNETFAEHNAKTVAVNFTAKRVHDRLKHCDKPFKEAMLWQAMLSRMRKAGTAQVPDLPGAPKRTISTR